MEEQGEGENIWGLMIKQTLKRRKSGFSESYYGFRSFGQLLEETGANGILRLERNEKSGASSSRALSCCSRCYRHWGIGAHTRDSALVASRMSIASPEFRNEYRVPGIIWRSTSV